jgi:chemotaxis protein methyltransferase CheR
MSLTSPEYKFIARMLQDRTGVQLGDNKQSLVESRLAVFLLRSEFSNPRQLLAQLRYKEDEDLKRKIIEAILINETSFFRDAHPFHCIKDFVLPELIKKRKATQNLSIWSAACSSGQEVYSIAMTLYECFPQVDQWKLSLTASDISLDILEKAQAGLFKQLEVNRGLPAKFLVRFFKRERLRWKIDPRIKKMVQFRQINLIEPWSFIGRQDIILLRNVLFYFDIETRKTVLSRIRQHLKPDGFLFLGASETTLNIDKAFEQVKFGRTICYRLKDV